MQQFFCQGLIRRFPVETLSRTVIEQVDGMIQIFLRIDSSNSQVMQYGAGWRPRRSENLASRRPHGHHASLTLDESAPSLEGALSSSLSLVCHSPRVFLFNTRGAFGVCGNPSCVSHSPRALLSLASFCPRCEVFFKARGAFRRRRRTRPMLLLGPRGQAVLAQCLLSQLLISVSALALS